MTQNARRTPPRHPECEWSPVVFKGAHFYKRFARLCPSRLHPSTTRRRALGHGVASAWSKASCAFMQPFGFQYHAHGRHFPMACKAEPATGGVLLPGSVVRPTPQLHKSQWQVYAHTSRAYPKPREPPAPPAVSFFTLVSLSLSRCLIVA